MESCDLCTAKVQMAWRTVALLHLGGNTSHVNRKAHTPGGVAQLAFSHLSARCAKKVSHQARTHAHNTAPPSFITLPAHKHPYC